MGLSASANCGRRRASLGCSAGGVGARESRGCRSWWSAQSDRRSSCLADGSTEIELSSPNKIELFLLRNERRSAKGNERRQEKRQTQRWSLRRSMSHHSATTSKKSERQGGIGVYSISGHVAPIYETQGTMCGEVLELPFSTTSTPVSPSCEATPRCVRVLCKARIVSPCAVRWTSVRLMSWKTLKQSASTTVEWQEVKEVVCLRQRV